MTAAPGRAQQGETDGDKEQNEEDAVLAFNAMQACFKLGEGACVHERKYCKRLISKVFERLRQVDGIYREDMLTPSYFRNGSGEPRQ